MSKRTERRDTKYMSEQELFLEFLKHPGFEELYTVLQKFVDDHQPFIVDSEIHSYVNKHREFRVVLWASDVAVLRMTKVPFRTAIKAINNKTMVHIQTNPSFSEEDNLYSLASYVDL